ncbi:hypothetical protein EMCRGX_G009082 [Ephydatia muelleri]
MVKLVKEVDLVKLVEEEVDLVKLVREVDLVKLVREEVHLVKLVGEEVDLLKLVREMDLVKLVREIDLEKLVEEAVDLVKLVREVDLVKLVREEVDLVKLVREVDLVKLVREEVDLVKLVGEVDLVKLVREVDLVKLGDEKSSYYMKMWEIYHPLVASPPQNANISILMGSGILTSLNVTWTAAIGVSRYNVYEGSPNTLGFPSANGVLCPTATCTFLINLYTDLSGKHFTVCVSSLNVVGQNGTANCKYNSDCFRIRSQSGTEMMTEFRYLLQLIKIFAPKVGLQVPAEFQKP